MSCFSRRQISPQYLVNFGEHGSLLNQPLIAPSTDTHSIQTDEKELADAATVTPRPPSPANDKDSDKDERHWVFASPGRCYHITLIVLAVLLVVVAAVALPLWLVPSGTGKMQLNRLPSHIRTSSTYTLFLTRLKTHLFAESLL